MNTCKDCHHWKSWSATHPRSIGARNEGLLVGSCLEIEKEGNDYARVRSYEGVSTEANFGCIHFTPKHGPDEEDDDEEFEDPKQ